MKYFKHLFFLFFVSKLFSQDLALFKKHMFIFENDTLNYRILKPLNYQSNKKYPVHLFLHGIGERGNDNHSQLKHGADLFLKKENRENFNSWVIFPQCSKDNRWDKLPSDLLNINLKNEISKPSKSLGLVISLMDGFIKKKQVDKQKIYVTGLSMGGMGTFEILIRRPNMFAAATPICGDGVPELVKLFAKKVPVWIFHGSDDKTVSAKHSLKMAKAILDSGGSPKMTLYENTGHDSWNNAFAEKDFLKWIHSKSKK